MANSYKLAVIGGDGIGPEVTAEALKVLRAATPDVTWETTDYDLGARRYHKSGETLPDSVLAEIRAHDAIQLGAIGDPSVPSGVLERGLLLRLRFQLDHNVNLRPVRPYPRTASPLLKGSPETIDMVVVREGTEGPYTGAGGMMRRGTAQELATQESFNTAFGVARVARYAFSLAQGRPRRKLTLVHKTNVLTFAGDIGLAASGKINPEGTSPSMFEPVHGSAPDIAGQSKADPTAAILSAAMLLSHLGYADAAARVEQAVADDLVKRQGAGTRTTVETGDDIATRVSG